MAPPTWGPSSPLSESSSPYRSVRSHKSCACSSRTTPLAGLFDTTPIATPISPWRMESGDVGGYVETPPTMGGVEGRARVGGGPGRGMSGMSPRRLGLVGTAPLLDILPKLAESVADIMDAVVVGILEKLLRLPSIGRRSSVCTIQPNGEVGGEALKAFEWRARSDRGMSLLAPGAKTGDDGKPALGWTMPADEGRLLGPVSSILRSFRRGGGVSGIP